MIWKRDAGLTHAAHPCSLRPHAYAFRHHPGHPRAAHLAVRGWAARYQGNAPLDLTQAVPGYPAHPELLARPRRRRAGPRHHRLWPHRRRPAPAEALAADTAAFYRAPIEAGIAITAGCNLAFAMVMATIAGPGAKIGLPTPWYFNHQMTLLMQGATPVPIPCRADDGFIPYPARLEKLLDGLTAPSSSPNNPTGAVYPAPVLHEIAAMCRRKNVWLVLDETYRDFLPDSATPPHALFTEPGWEDYLIGLYSFLQGLLHPRPPRGRRDRRRPSSARR